MRPWSITYGISKCLGKRLCWFKNEKKFYLYHNNARKYEYLINYYRTWTSQNIIYASFTLTLEFQRDELTNFDLEESLCIVTSILYTLILSTESHIRTYVLLEQVTLRFFSRITIDEETFRRRQLIDQFFGQ